MYNLDFNIRFYVIISITLDGCPDGSKPVNCKADPCQFATCPYFPEATCEADYCGGCNARFFVGKEHREVTALCATGNTFKLMHKLLQNHFIYLYYSVQVALMEYGQ